MHFSKGDFYGSFDYSHSVNSASYIQNPKGRKLPNDMVEKFEAFHTDFSDIILGAENNATDFVDWRRGLSISGIYSLPEELRIKVISYFSKPPSKSFLNSFLGIALFSNIFINKLYLDSLEKYTDDNEIEEELFKSIDSIVSMYQSAFNMHLRSYQKEKEKHLLMDERLKAIYLENSESNLEGKYPCQSDKLYKDCCANTLRFYNYSHYYDW